jgi:hypothetical protein
MRPNCFAGSKTNSTKTHTATNRVPVCTYSIDRVKVEIQVVMERTRQTINGNNQDARHYE